ncbi:MAG: hypothetical protein WC141_04465 [Arcobacteraceae bacterium]
MLQVLKQIRDNLQIISVPHFPLEGEDYCIDNSLKVQAISEVLNKLGIDYVVDDRYGIIVAKDINKLKVSHQNRLNKAIKKRLESVDLILTSHIDMISKFNNFEVLNKFKEEISKLNNENESISGPLDNTITNAILLALLKSRKEACSDNLDDVMVIFSIGEEMLKERGFKENGGIKNFMKKFNGDINDNVKFINLDVSANEYHEYRNDTDIAVLIEYDDNSYPHKVDKSGKYSKLDFFKDGDILANVLFCDYGEDGTSDDLEEVTAYEETFGITLGLNTYGTIHSKSNSTSIKNINVYFNQLNKFFENKLFRPNL